MKKKTKDKQTRALLESIKKERRRAYWSMPIPILHIVLLFVALLFVSLSYVLSAKTSWMSSFFQSCGTGIITGIVVFVLGNIRSQVKENANNTVEQLAAMYEILKRVYDSVPDKFTNKISGQKYDYRVCVINTINAATEYVDSIKKLDYSIKKKFIEETAINYQDMFDAIERFREMELPDDLNYNDAFEIRSDIIYIIQNATEWFENILRKAEIQKEQICKYPF